MQAEDINRVFSDIGQLLPDLLALFESASLKMVYVNSAGMARLDPTSTGSLENAALPDYIGVADADRYQREIYPQLHVRGIWKGNLALRDRLGAEFGTKATLQTIRLQSHHYVVLHADLPRTAAEDTELLVTDEDMLYALLETTPSSVYFKDIASRYLRISRDKATKHGLSDPRDSIGKTDFDYFTAEHATPAYEDEQRIIKTGVPIIDYEEKETFADGSIRWVSSTKLPFHSRSGKLVGTYGISRDITAQKLAAERLRLLSRAIEQSHSSIVITDTDGCIQYVNPYFETVTGYTAAEVVGQNPRVLKSGHQPEVFYDEMWLSLTHGYEWSGELKNRRKNGTTFWEQAYISAVRDENNRITHYIAVKEDITQRKTAEESLRQREALFRAVFNGSNDAILLFNEDKFMDCNAKASQLFGYTREEITSLGIADISSETQPDGRPSQEAGQDFVQQAIAYGLAHFEWIHRRKDGTCFPSEVVLTSFSFEGRTIIHGAIRDLTEKKLAERERRDLESRLQLSSKLESVGSLAAGVAHEINTPTQFISDNIRFLQDSFRQISNVIAAYKAQIMTDPVCTAKLAAIAAFEQENELDYLLSEIPRCLDQSLDGLRRIAKIVGSLKEFSHPGSDAKSHADINRAIDTTIAVSRHEWKYVAEVATELDPGLPHVNCILDEINQAILNLVVNAAHAIEDSLKQTGRKQGLITIRTRTEGDNAVIEVQDTGTGIPVHVRDKIFEPFFTTKAVGRGTGQGLAIVQAIVAKKHNGSISFTTEIGKGTTFKISIPIQGPQTRPPQAPQEKSPKS